MVQVNILWKQPAISQKKLVVSIFIRKIHNTKFKLEYKGNSLSYLQGFPL